METAGERFLRKVRGFDGTNVEEQKRVYFAAQAEFTAEWERKAKEVAAEHKRLGKKPLL